jgi:tRNA-2-methylthio-N6-dimethylallyladenosine synthase
MAQRLGEGLLRRHGGVDVVCGPGQLARLPELIASAGSAAQLALDPPRKQPRDDDRIDRLDNARDPARTHLPAQAYVRIMRGCDKFCTYCVVPLVRGAELSRSPDAIVEEVRRLAGAGVTQVTLLGQTVNSYRHAAPGGSVGLADLLERIDAVEGLRRVRFVTNYPGDFDRAILQAMRDLPTVCEHLHLPAQSGSDRVLRAMGRRYTRSQYDELIDAARETVPGLGIAGDFIVGFPGEGEEDHRASADLIRRSRYKNSFIFKYSPRPGTRAADVDDDVGDPVKRRRNAELLAVQEEVSLAGNRELIAQTVEVLVEGPSPRADRPDGARQLVGRTRTDHIVVFDGPGELAGRHVNVEVADASALTLFGKISRV